VSGVDAARQFHTTKYKYQYDTGKSQNYKSSFFDDGSIFFLSKIERDV